MYFVYVLHSESDLGRRSIGFSEGIDRRVDVHNEGENPSTKAYRPWVLTFYAAFERKADALGFERYLKSGSGTAFARKRLHPMREAA